VSFLEDSAVAWSMTVLLRGWLQPTLGRLTAAPTIDVTMPGLGSVQ